MTRFFKRDAWLPWLAVSVLFLAGSWTSSADAAEKTGFTSGNMCYQKGDFAGATTAYETQVRRGEYSANLFFNLGDAYYQHGERGRAALNYERALVLEPSHAEAAANLAFLRGKPASAGLTGGWNWNRVAVLAAVAGWLGVAGMVTAASARRLRTAGLGVAAVGFLTCVAAAGAIWFLDDGAGYAARAIVVADRTPALYAPAENSKLVTTLSAGVVVKILSEQGAWSYVLLNDGTHAWVSAERIEKLVPVALPRAGA